MTRPRILDLYCGAGGCSDGYVRAGFDVVGVDLDATALRHYPYPSLAADALEVLADPDYLDGFDAVHASPPCHGYSRTRALSEAQGHPREEYDDHVPEVVDALTAWGRRTGRPWVVENVPGAPMEADSVVLCGRAYGLGVRRHRLFASNVLLLGPGCACGTARPVGVYGKTYGDTVPQGGRVAADLSEGLAAMGQPAGRMPWRYLVLSIPPAYTEGIGAQLLDHLVDVPAAAR